jgi:hypothetical protein
MFRKTQLPPVKRDPSREISPDRNARVERPPSRDIVREALARSRRSTGMVDALRAALERRGR